MASLNDYKLLEQKCISLWEMVNKDEFKEDYISKLSNKEKARFGFYYFAVGEFAGVSELDDITECICDTDFNAKTFCDPQEDYGIDAVCIDDETKDIHFFNFKYREVFNPNREQKKDEAWQSSKFFASLLNGDTQLLSSRLKQIAIKVLGLYNGNEIWHTHFYIVSNESQAISCDDVLISQMKSLNEMEVHTVGLDDVAPFLSRQHKNINSSLLLPSEAVMSFTENALASNKSYIVRLPLSELVRITCDSESIRMQYNIEDYEPLKFSNIDLDVLFDNVRGYILNSKFNKNIATTLEYDPTKFFFYNNGLTLVANNIVSSPVNGGKKIKLQINNFQVLNGGQTLRTIHEYNRSDEAHFDQSIVKAEVLVRILNITDENIKNCIAEYTNSQNSIDLIDLKSLRKEQLQLESFFAENKILYVRKKGGGTTSAIIANFQIGIQRVGQILLATKKGRPDETSNKKRAIFSVYYDELFTNNQDLISDKTLESVTLYHRLKAEYRKAQCSYTEQKAMYVLYILSRKHQSNIADVIKKLDTLIEKYKTDNKLDVALSRILIRPAFRMEVDRSFEFIAE